MFLPKTIDNTFVISQIWTVLKTGFNIFETNSHFDPLASTCIIYQDREEKHGKP